VPDDQFPLPEGAVLVHVGPYKTGTTAIQTTLHEQRAELLRHGVLYPGTDHRQFRAEWALTGRTPHGVPPVPRERWDELVEEVRATAAARVCISSEGLASARPEVTRRLVDDLGPDRVHLLVVARRLDKLLPSGWQERVKSSQEPRSYDEWLRQVLDGDRSSGPARSFWYNQGLGNLLQRWRSALPADRIWVLVADESDRTQQLRTFERLLGLPENLLAPGPRSNTSLSYDRVEFYRLINQAFDAHGWDDAHRRKLVTRGLLTGLTAAPPAPTDVPLPRLPRWAAQRVAELSDERVQEVRRSGARVIGDPELLRLPGSEGPGAGEATADEDPGELPTSMPIRTAVDAVETLVAAALDLERTAVRKAARRGGGTGAEETVENLSTRELLRIVARRQRARFRSHPR
jgi:hypothetical protein